MKDLKSLAPFSLVGIIAMVYTSLAMLYRWLIASPILATATDTAETVAEVLSTSNSSDWWKLVFNPSASILISMLSTAFMAHYNAPKFYWELAQRSTPRYNRVVASSFIGATFLMATVAAAGFGTFGAASKGMILNNYPVDDKLMALSRLAVTISLICSYPLAFVGVRDGILDLGGVTDRTRRNGLFVPLTIVLLLAVTAVAFVVKDISIIMALGGATWGNALIYLFPAFMLIQLANKQQDLKKEVPSAILTGGIGLVLAVVGTSTAIKAL
jgi:amino acid permease